MSFNQDLSSWNVKKVTTMEKMFNESDAFNQNLGAWHPEVLVTAANFFNANTPVSRTNYDALLNGWAAKTLRSNVPFGAQGKQYCFGTDSRNDTLIAGK